MSKMDEQLNLWANGRLPEAERRAFEEKMAEDPALAREAEFARALRQTLRSEAPAPPGELGLARLHKAMGEAEPAAAQTKAQGRFWKPLAIAACVMVALQTALLLRAPAPGHAGINLAPAAGGSVSSGPQLQIIFAPTATTTEIQAAVQSVNGSIVAGPSALGIFRLAPGENVSMTEAEETLRAFVFVDEVIAP